LFLSPSRSRRIPSVLHGARVALSLGAAWLGAGCTESAAVPTSSSTGGETVTDAAAPDAGEIEPATCVQCSQAHQGDCHELAQKCTDDPRCRKILDCTFPSDTEGCGLDKAGGKCTRSCMDRRCSDVSSGELYLQLEQCLYCDEPCASSCESYCKALGPEKGPGACEAAAGGAAQGGAGGEGGVGGAEGGVGGAEGGVGAVEGGASGAGGSGAAQSGASGFGVGGGGASGFGGVGGASGGAGTGLAGGLGASAGAAGSTAVAMVAGASGSAGLGAN
jgi:hypothetical protein